jgi:predicted GIY-YIG superfamily endonuclease
MHHDFSEGLARGEGLEREFKACRKELSRERSGLKLLVWLEHHGTMLEAIALEKAFTEWKRAWKLKLIEEMNPIWRDLYLEIAV